VVNIFDLIITSRKRLTGDNHTWVYDKWNCC